MAASFDTARDAVERLALGVLNGLDDDPTRLPVVARVAVLLGSEILAARLVAYIAQKAEAMALAHAPLPTAVEAFAEALSLLQPLVESTS